MGVKHLLSKNKVDVIDGYGKIGEKRFESRNHCKKTKEKQKDQLLAKHVIIATGARIENCLIYRQMANLYGLIKMQWYLK